MGYRKIYNFFTGFINSHRSSTLATRLVQCSWKLFCTETERKWMDNTMISTLDCVQLHGLGQAVYTVYPKKYAHGFVVLCFVVVMQSLLMNSHEVFIHIHQGCFAGTGAIARLPQCQWSKPDEYRKISQCITTTKHSKAKTVCIFLGIYCMSLVAVYVYFCAASMLCFAHISVPRPHYSIPATLSIWFVTAKGY